MDVVVGSIHSKNDAVGIFKLLVWPGLATRSKTRTQSKRDQRQMVEQADGYYNQIETIEPANEDAYA